MATLCAVPECPGSTRGKQRGEKIYFFKALEDQLQEWSDLIPGNVKLTITDRLCSRHFEDEDIMKDWVFKIDGSTVTMPRGRWTLKVGAVPKIFGSYKVDYRPRRRCRAVEETNSEEPTEENSQRMRKRKPKTKTQSLADGNSSEEESCVPHKKRSKNQTPVDKNDAKPTKRRRGAGDCSNRLTKKKGSKPDRGKSASFDDDGSSCSRFLSGAETTNSNSVIVEERRVSDGTVEKDLFEGDFGKTVVSSQILTPPKRKNSNTKIVVKKEKCDEGYLIHDLEVHDSPEYVRQNVQGNGWAYEGIVVKREMCDCEMQCSVPLEESENTDLHPTTLIFHDEIPQPFEGPLPEHEDLSRSPSQIEENGVTLKLSVPDSVIASVSSFDSMEEQAFKPSTTEIDAGPILSTPSLSIDRDKVPAADVIIHEEEATSRSGTEIDSPDESSQCASVHDSPELGSKKDPALNLQTCLTSKIDCDKLTRAIPLPEITITPVVKACSMNEERPHEDPKSTSSNRPDFTENRTQLSVPGVTHECAVSSHLEIKPIERPGKHVPPLNSQGGGVSELTGFVEGPLRLDAVTIGSKGLKKSETLEIIEDGLPKMQREEELYSDVEMDFLGFESDKDEVLAEKRKYFRNSSDMAVKSAKIYFSKQQEACKLKSPGSSARIQPNVDEPTVMKAIEQLKQLAPRTSRVKKISKPPDCIKAKPGYHKDTSVMKNVATALENASKDMIQHDLVRNGVKSGFKYDSFRGGMKSGFTDDSLRNGMKSGFKDVSVRNDIKSGFKDDSVRNGMKLGSEDCKILRTSNCPPTLNNVTISSNPPQCPGKPTQSENILTVDKFAPNKGILPIKYGQTSLDRILQAANITAPSQIRDPAADKTSLILKNFKSDGVLALECVVLREQVRRLQKELFLQKQLLVDSEHNASILQRKLELQSQLPCPKCAGIRPVIGKETLI